MERAFILYLVEAPNGKRYVGITSRSIADRWFEHLQESRCSRTNRAISNAIRKYGASAFKVSEFDRATNWQELCGKERAAIAWYNTFAPAGYNLTRGGDGFTGRHSPQTREKMRKSACGKVRSEQHRRNLSAALTGRKQPPEVTAKVVAAKRGKPLTDAQRRGLASMRRQNLGRVPTAEHRAKISAANRGRSKPSLRGRPWSAERRAKISAAHRRNRTSPSQQELFNGL